MLDLRKACLCEPTGKLLRRIGPLYVLLERALPRIILQPLEKIQQDTERDNYLTAQQAKEYGLIDEVIAHR